MPVPPPAVTASGDDNALSGCIKIGEENVVIGVVNQRAGRDGDDQILARLAVHFLPHARFAALGLPVMPAAEIEQRVLVRVGDEDDAPAVARHRRRPGRPWECISRAETRRIPFPPSPAFT